jgi:hypothetical protein
MSIQSESWGWFKWGTATIVVLGGLYGVATVVGVVTTPLAIVNKILQPDNVLYNYEWFKQQVQDVKAIDQKINAFTATLKAFEVSAGPRDSWKFDDRQEWNRINSVLTGLTGQRASMVAEYNAKSQMANRTLFKTSDLPEQL